MLDHHPSFDLAGQIVEDTNAHSLSPNHHPNAAALNHTTHTATGVEQPLSARESQPGLPIPAHDHHNNRKTSSRMCGDNPSVAEFAETARGRKRERPNSPGGIKCPLVPPSPKRRKTSTTADSPEPAPATGSEENGNINSPTTLGQNNGQLVRGKGGVDDSPLLQCEEPQAVSSIRNLKRTGGCAGRHPEPTEHLRYPNPPGPSQAVSVQPTKFFKHFRDQMPYRVQFFSEPVQGIKRARDRATDPDEVASGAKRHRLSPPSETLEEAGTLEPRRFTVRKSQRPEGPQIAGIEAMAFTFVQAHPDEEMPERNLRGHQESPWSFSSSLMNSNTLPPLREVLAPPDAPSTRISSVNGNDSPIPPNAVTSSIGVSPISHPAPRLPPLREILALSSNSPPLNSDVGVPATSYPTPHLLPLQEFRASSGPRPASPSSALEHSSFISPLSSDEVNSEVQPIQEIPEFDLFHPPHTTGNTLAIPPLPEEAKPGVAGVSVYQPSPTLSPSLEIPSGHTVSQEESQLALDHRLQHRETIIQSPTSSLPVEPNYVGSGGSSNRKHRYYHDIVYDSSREQEENTERPTPLVTDAASSPACSPSGDLINVAVESVTAEQQNEDDHSFFPGIHAPSQNDPTVVLVEAEDETMHVYCFDSDLDMEASHNGESYVSDSDSMSSPEPDTVVFLQPEENLTSVSSGVQENGDLAFVAESRGSSASLAYYFDSDLEMEDSPSSQGYSPISDVISSSMAAASGGEPHILDNDSSDWLPERGNSAHPLTHHQLPGPQQPLREIDSPEPDTVVFLRPEENLTSVSPSVQENGDLAFAAESRGSSASPAYYFDSDLEMEDSPSSQQYHPTFNATSSSTVAASERLNYLHSNFYAPTPSRDLRPGTLADGNGFYADTEGEVLVGDDWVFEEDLSPVQSHVENSYHQARFLGDGIMEGVIAEDASEPLSDNSFMNPGRSEGVFDATDDAEAVDIAVQHEDLYRPERAYMEVDGDRQGPVPRMDGFSQTTQARISLYEDVSDSRDDDWQRATPIPDGSYPSGYQQPLAMEVDQGGPESVYSMDGSSRTQAQMTLHEDAPDPEAGDWQRGTPMPHDFLPSGHRPSEEPAQGPANSPRQETSDDGLEELLSHIQALGLTRMIRDKLRSVECAEKYAILGILQELKGCVSPNETSGSPQVNPTSQPTSEESSRTPEQQQKTPSPSGPYRRPKRRTKAVNTERQDIRKELRDLAFPNNAPITTITPAQRTAFEQGRAPGPTLQSFSLELVSRQRWDKNKWNHRAAEVFADHYRSLDGNGDVGVQCIKDTVRCYLKTLQERYFKANPTEQILQQQMTDRRYARRKRRCELRLDQLYRSHEHFEGWAVCAEAYGILKPEHMSGDETDEEDEKTFFITQVDWRSKELQDFLRHLSALQLASRHLPNNKYSPGEFPAVRKPSSRPDRAYQRAPVGLPINWYDELWLDAEPHRRLSLQPKPALSLAIPDDQLKLAQRFLHVRTRNDKPLPA